MKEPEHEDQHAPLSYHGAGRIVWLVFLLIIVWVILRALQPVILLFALVFLIAMVLNPIVVWLHKYRIPRFVSVILLMLVLVAITTTIIVFAIPPQARNCCATRPTSGMGFVSGSNRLAEIIQQFAKHCRRRRKSPERSAQPREWWGTFC